MGAGSRVLPWDRHLLTPAADPLQTPKEVTEFGLAYLLPFLGEDQGSMAQAWAVHHVPGRAVGGRVTARPAGVCRRPPQPWNCFSMFDCYCLKWLEILKSFEVVLENH